MHGGSLKLTDAQKTMRSLSTWRTGFGGAAEAALSVDRLRDLVRRAILARVALATGDEPLWPIAGKTPVDALLADDGERQRWRAAWRERVGSINSGAADRAQTPVDFLSRSGR